MRKASPGAICVLLGVVLLLAALVAEMAQIGYNKAISIDNITKTGVNE